MLPCRPALPRAAYDSSWPRPRWTIARPGPRGAGTALVRAHDAAALKADGVTVKIITGDNELVTQHICGQVGLPADEIVLGDAVERMSDPALAAVAERVQVFARVSPMQKNRIILALRGRGHVVGCIGDGINDPPHSQVMRRE